MPERQPPKLTKVDRELFKIEDAEIKLHERAYVDLFNTYGFLMTAFFGGVDGANVTIDIKVGKKTFVVDTEDIFRKTIPAIIEVEASRLMEMGRLDFVLKTNDGMQKKWGTKK